MFIIFLDVKVEQRKYDQTNLNEKNDINHLSNAADTVSTQKRFLKYALRSSKHKTSDNLVCLSHNNQQKCCIWKHLKLPW